MKTLEKLFIVWISCISFSGAKAFAEANAGCSSFSCLPRHMAKMTSGTTQSIANETWETVNFTSEKYDLGDIASISTDKITIKRDGVYDIKAHFTILMGTTSGHCGIVVKLNGSSYLLNDQHDPMNTGACYSRVAGDYVLEKDDELTMEIFQNSGSTKTTNYTSIDRTPTLSITQLN